QPAGWETPAELGRTKGTSEDAAAGRTGSGVTSDARAGVGTQRIWHEQCAGSGLFAKPMRRRQQSGTRRVRAEPYTRPMAALGDATRHLIVEGDARELSWIEDASVHLVVTSPPYGLLKTYADAPGQLGNGDDPTSVAAYEEFLDELDKCWSECVRVLVPGGRICCVVGDICLSRRAAGRHFVLPLAADSQVRARSLGLDNLTPIRWLKVANIKLEASQSSWYLGKPNLPGGIVKNDIETILMLRKPGGYRKPTAEMERGSFIPTEAYRLLFRPVWDDVKGASGRRWKHPAPYPV